MRKRLCFKGIVQGVGFRPYIYSLAEKHGLSGFVMNTGRGVEAEAQGEEEAVDRFVEDVTGGIPPIAFVESFKVETIPDEDVEGFEIRGSLEDDGMFPLISPDIATCGDCLRELFDPGDRRYLYPFINCTNCGPRFTIITGTPYDRPLTTMREFTMCEKCAQEYSDTGDRRFHAQPNACDVCGPRLCFAGRDGAVTSERGRALSDAAGTLRGGGVVAVKGIGGYHLACGAADERAVSELRSRKFREDKPFAVMVRDIDEARRYCFVSEAEEKVLAGSRRPIVLLRRRAGAPVADSVAPGNPELGIMLPYTPLHHLLLAEAGGALVMTSGNRSDEPIAFEDGAAFERLGGIADAFLFHNRRIHVRCDDSVVRVWRGKERAIRRARGYAPSPLPLAIPAARPVLACGAEVKNTFCAAVDNYAFLSQHIGDLDNLETLYSYKEGISRFERMLRAEPKMIVYDLHPEYLSTKYALERNDVEKLGVQHHHAHIASCLADNCEEGPVIGVAMDGQGYGLDGTLWGGEWLIADAAGFVRAAHIRPALMPGGAIAIKQPWRMAAGALYSFFGERIFERGGAPLLRLCESDRKVFFAALDRRINCPLTTSMGRVFDIVSAIVTGRGEVNYEGQAAVELEALAAGAAAGSYEFSVESAGGEAVSWGRPPVAPELFKRCLQVDFAPAIMGVIYDMESGVNKKVIACGFHETAAAAIVKTCLRLRDVCGISTAALSGGVFQNMVLSDKVVDGLEAAGFRVLTHSRVPANDGGLPLGQAYVAAAVMRNNQ